MYFNRDWFIEHCIGAFPDGAWYYELHCNPDKTPDDETARKQLEIFSRAVESYLEVPMVRTRARVMTRTAKFADKHGDVHYIHYILCTRRHQAAYRDIAQAWHQWTGGSARAEVLHTRADAERRAIAIAHYYLPQEVDPNGPPG